MLDIGGDDGGSNGRQEIGKRVADILRSSPGVVIKDMLHSLAHIYSVAADDKKELVDDAVRGFLEKSVIDEQERDGYWKMYDTWKGVSRDGRDV